MTALSSTREYQRAREAAYRIKLRNDPTRLAERQIKTKAWRDANPEKRKRYQVNRAVMWREKKPWFLAFKTAKRRAKRFGMQFALTADWARAQFDAGSPLSGLPFSGENGPFFPSIDRIDSCGGYTPENCRMVLRAENLFKNEWSDEVVKTIARAIAARCAS